jgi:hypothetical protein
MRFEILQDTTSLHHQRHDYNIIELLGDIGGIHLVYSSVFAAFFIYFAEFNFLIDIFNKVFILDKDDKMLLFKQNCEKLVNIGGVKKRTKKVKYVDIDFSIKYYLELLILYNFSFMAPCFQNGRRKRKMIEIAQESIDEQFDYTLFFKN